MIVWHRTTMKMAKKALKARDGAAVDIDSEVCEGEIKLEITPFESFNQVDKYKKYLATVNGLRIVSESWSEEDEGYIITVSVRVPLVLGRVLRDMPEVARVQLNGQKRGGQKMVVVMKDAAVSPAPVPA
jgi:hypothetical protein